MKFLRKIDPAHQNLRSAVRGTLAVVISYFIGSQFSPVLGFLGGILALLASVLDMDSAPETQKVTTLLKIPIALVAITTGILLSFNHTIQLTFFVFATFLALYLRRWGMRWIALGMIVFMAYFLPLFFPLKNSGFIPIYLTCTAAILTVYVLRYFIFSDNQEKILRKLLKEWNAEYVSPITNFIRLNELTLMIENLTKDRSEDFQLEMFEREVDLQYRGKRNPEPLDVTKYPLKTSSVIPPSEADNDQGLLPTTKLAIQGTISVALASYLGTLVSTQRWYWASIAAFVILAGTSRGETLVRATLRVLGTILGLLAGVALAPMIAGHAHLEWTLIILSIFFGIFSAKFTFGFWSATVFTFMLTVLFNVMGQYTDTILLLRFEETLLGALIGVIVSTLVLPSSTKEVMGAAVTKTLRSMEEVVKLLPLVNSDFESKKNLVSMVRAMEREHVALKTLAVPYTERYSIIKNNNIVKAFHHTTLLRHYIKDLATRKSDPGALDRLSEIRDMLKRVDGNPAKLRDENFSHLL